MKVLVLCTGNRCRSQMAEGWLKKLVPDWKVFSAGISPAGAVHPFAMFVMMERGMNICKARPKSVDQFLAKEWDYVITVCGNAEKTCPIFKGRVGQRLHIGFDDPDAFTGSPFEILDEFRRVRDEIGQKMSVFVNEVSDRQV